MKRAFLIEAAVMAQYIRQLLPIGLIVAVAMTIGVGNVSAAASVFVMMACMLSCTAMCAYDDMTTGARSACRCRSRVAMWCLVAMEW